MKTLKISQKTVTYITIFVIFLFCNAMQAQNRNARTVFGIHASPAFSNTVLENTNIEYENEGIKYEFRQRIGFSYGLEIRHDFNDYLSLFGGLNYTRRTSALDVTDTDGTKSTRLKYISYEIPVNLMVFFRLGRNLYMDYAAGFVVNFAPTDIYEDSVYIQKTRWINPALNGNFGLEYRAGEAGTFYIGASYHYLLTRMYELFAYQNGELALPTAHLKISSNYFSVNFKYYFPEL